LTINYQLRTREHDEQREGPSSPFHFTLFLQLIETSSGGHIPALIGKIVSWRMEEIKIGSEIESVDADVWAEVDQHLNRPQFERLQRLVIRVRTHRMTELEGTIQGYLPIANAHQKLVFA
jgi:hypothetical protein